MREYLCRVARGVIEVFGPWWCLFVAAGLVALTNRGRPDLVAALTVASLLAWLLWQLLCCVAYVVCGIRGFFREAQAIGLFR